jgi:hypothetical protein
MSQLSLGLLDGIMRHALGGLCVHGVGNTQFMFPPNR